MRRLIVEKERCLVYSGRLFLCSLRATGETYCRIPDESESAAADRFCSQQQSGADSDEGQAESVKTHRSSYPPPSPMHPRFPEAPMSSSNVWVSQALAREYPFDGATDKSADEHHALDVIDRRQPRTTAEKSAIPVRHVSRSELADSFVAPTTAPIPDNGQNRWLSVLPFAVASFFCMRPRMSANRSSDIMLCKGSKE
ncbi:hypothetical protein [Lysobacter capsici]